ncbi:MAG: hypothetical protein AAF518_28930, partial [Spirochaetota bacterium]
MARGYHSRSPEEFREFLDSLNQQNKKKTWRNIVIFLDIIILCVVFAIAVKFLNPGRVSNRSNKVRSANVQMYMTRSSQAIGKQQVSYFLMVENLSSQDLIFAKDGVQGEFLRTSVTIVCSGIVKACSIHFVVGDPGILPIRRKSTFYRG